MPTNSPRAYRHIRAWGRMLSSHDYYISDQQELASKEHAPLDATYRDVGPDGRWHTFGEVTRDDTRRHIEKLLSGAR